MTINFQLLLAPYLSFSLTLPDYQSSNPFALMALTQQHLKPISSSSSSFFHLLNPSTLPPPPFSVKTHSDSLFFFRPRTVQSLHNSAPTFTRRLFLPSVSSIWDALTGGTNNAREAVMAIRRGMSLFRQVNMWLLDSHCNVKF